MSQLKAIATLESFLERAKEGEIDGIVIVATRGQNYVSHGIHCDNEYFPIVLASLNATTRKLNRLWDENVFQRTDDEVIHDPGPGDGATVSGLDGAKVTRDEKGNVTVTLPDAEDTPAADAPAEDPGAGGDQEPDQS